MRLLIPKTRRLLISLLLVPSMLGCANSMAHSPKQGSGNISRTSPIRVIVTFDQLPAINDQRPLELLAEVCNCTPVFIRQFLGSGAIYEITLPPDLTYSGFQTMLLNRGAALGVRAVEQDTLDQYQR